MTTSGRRWDRHGAWRTIALMWRLRAAYALGADPQALALRYGYQPPPPAVPAAVAILAKAPRPGYAKTRLIPRLGAAAAAGTQRTFIRDTADLALQAGLGPVSLWCAPDAAHPLFRALARRGRLVMRGQVEGDLGDRLRAIVQDHFARAALPLLLVGTDCPVLAPGHLQAAARSLATHDAVLIPAQDGGYVALGLRRALPSLFDGIAWSTAAVAAQTRERLRAAGATWTELPGLWDVDEATDWDRLQHLLNPLPHSST